MSINLHEGQSEVFEDMFVHKKCRYSVVNCSRGWGKSYEAAVAGITAVFELLELESWVPNKVVYIIAPTYDQVKDIYYPLINYELGMERYALKSSRDLGRFVFPKRVELRLLSYEAIERMRGKGAYFVVWDEVSSCVTGVDPKEAWQSIIQPCIVTRWSNARAMTYGAKSPGRALIIGTPKGYNYFYELYNFRELDDDWMSYTFDYTTSPFLDAEEIEKIKLNTDPFKFASEYMASFKESGNNCFYCFDRQKHVRKDLPYFAPPEDGEEFGETIYASIDFNVGIQATGLAALRGRELHYLDEMKGHPDTETLATALKTRFPQHKIIAYPDPTGKSRKSSAPVGRTDFSILQAAGIECVSRPSSPPIVDSVNAVNRKLLNAKQQIGMYVHPRCVGLIESLERTAWVDGNPNTATIDKTKKVEHYSDGVRYIVEYMFPVQSGSMVTARGFHF